MAFIAVLDANVLYSIALTDLFMTTAGIGLFRAHWSAEIVDEAKRNLLQDGYDREPIERRFQAMHDVEPGALVPPPAPELISAMTNDENDRHVLATAVMTNAEVIVTSNLRHFPPEACEPYGVEAQSPDEFAEHLVDLDSLAVWRAIEEMASRRRRPPESALEVLTHLTGYLPNAMQALVDAVLQPRMTNPQRLGMVRDAMAGLRALSREEIDRANEIWAPYHDDHLRGFPFTTELIGTVTALATTADEEAGMPIDQALQHVVDRLPDDLKETGSRVKAVVLAVHEGASAEEQTALLTFADYEEYSMFVQVLWNIGRWFPRQIARQLGIDEEKLWQAMTQNLAMRKGL